MHKLIHLDATMKQLWLHLCSDFSAQLGEGTNPFMRHKTALLQGGIPAFRQEPPVHCWKASPRLFRMHSQLESLFKRWRFQNDLLSDDTLRDMCRQDFLATQHRISTHQRQLRCTAVVTSHARSFITSMLGPYNRAHHEELNRFGRKAAVGLPAKMSYIDVRFSRISGSKEQATWYARHVGNDTLLQRLTKGVETNPHVDSLRHSCVPKSFKAMRGITPDTIIGGFYSAGLGSYIAERLCDNGLDITHLQARHRRIARKASITGEVVTADLKSASDSFTRDHLRDLLPQDWFDAVVYGLIPVVSVGDQKVELHSIMTMGMGFTFPLQTLLFYGLLMSIGRLLGLGLKELGKISVYGDDLIYPVRIHRYVTKIFSDLGFIINADKTFSDGSFRESCGGDFFHGVDVRPFMPESEDSGEVDTNAYEAFLYKLVNGLRERWGDWEIPMTLRYLVTEIVNANKHCGLCQVPPGYPSYSGIAVDKPQCPTLDWPWLPVDIKMDSWCLKFSFTSISCYKSKIRVEDCEPYLWDTLRASAQNDVSTGDEFYLPRYETRRVRPSYLTSSLRDFALEMRTRDGGKVGPIVWRRVKRRGSNVEKSYPYVSERNSPLTFTYTANTQQTYW